MRPDEQPTERNLGSPPKREPVTDDQWAWIKARVRTAMRTQLALDEVASTGADRSALELAVEGVVEGVAEEILSHLNRRPPTDNDSTHG